MTMPAPPRTPAGSRPPDTSRRRPVNRRSILAGLLLVMFLFGSISPVVAETVYLQEDDLPTQIDFSAQSAIIYTGDDVSGWGASQDLNNKAKLGLYLLNVELYPEIQYFYVDYHRHNENAAIPDGEYHTTYIRPSDESEQPMIVYVSNFYDLIGKYYRTRILAFPQNWDVGEKTGLWKQFIMFDGIQYPSGTGDRWFKSPSEPLFGGIFLLETSNNLCYFKRHSSAPIPEFGVVGSSSVMSTTKLEKTSENLLGISAIRDDGVNYYYSEYTIYDALDGIITYNAGNSNKTLGYFPLSDVLKIVIINPSIDGYNHTILYGLSESIPGDTPNNASVTVYIQNSQTGALISGINLNVNLYGTDTWYNSTLEWGWDTIQLPAGNYEFYAEKSGFTQYAPGRLTVDGVGDNINLLLYPDVVAPPAGNLTLQFWVCDSDLNGIPYAELSVLGLAGEGASFDSGIIQTNNLGYATLTAPGNSTYTAYASKPGYTAGENEFGVTTASPVHITVMLMRGAVPTQPTISPTITEPTPTQTTPPIQEDNIIGMSVMGLAKGFGIDYDMALLLFGLMIIFGAGGIVMSSVKGGAMEFIAGSIVGTFVAFALGLIPIWIFIIIAVVFGAYVLRVFVQGGQ